MSYRVNIGFKNVKNTDEVLQVLSDYKQYVRKKLSSLLEEYFYRMDSLSLYSYAFVLTETQNSSSDNNF